MRSSRTWPKPDLLQQRRLELGLPLEPAPVPPLFSLVLKGGIAGVALVMLTLLTLLGLQHRQQLVQAEIDALDPVEKRVGDAKARLRAMRCAAPPWISRRNPSPNSWWRCARGRRCWSNYDGSRLRVCALCQLTPTPPSC